MHNETLWSRIKRGSDTSTFSHSARLRMRVGRGGLAGIRVVEGGQGHPTGPQPPSSSRPQPAHYSGQRNLLEPLMHRAGPSGRALGHGRRNPSRTLCDRAMWAGVSGWEGTPERGYRPVYVFSGGREGVCCVAVFNSSVDPMTME